MAKNIEKVSVNKFETALPSENIISETLSGTEDVIFQVRRTIPLSEMIAFVSEVVTACVDAESGEYIPEAYDFAIRVGVLTHYANFAMPANMDKQYTLVYETRAFDQVAALINITQFNDIVRTIDRKIQFMLGVMSSSAVGKINEVFAKFSDIAMTAEKAFAGTDPSDIQKILSGVSKLKDMNDEQLAKIILDSKKDLNPDESVANKVDQ